MIASGPDSFVWWGWVGDHRGEIWHRSVEHVQLSAIAVGVGLVISSVLSLVAIRWRWTYAPITWFGSVLFTIPSVALFGMLVPFTGFGLLTAEIALVSYTILILVRNIVAGLDAVPASVRQAADAMGYTRARRLRTVDLPLAVPTIVAGMRIASVTVIGLVTVAALVGSGGYGAFIKDGLQRRFSTPVVVGATLSVALALVVDLGLAGLGRMLTPWQSRRHGGRT